MISPKAIDLSKDAFSPFYIGSVKLKNRIIMAPMETNMPSLNGEVNNRIIQYYKERAEGGAGAIIVEFTCVDSPTGKGTQAQLVMDNDGFIPGHTYLVEEIQKNDCKAFLQLHHAGRQTTRSITGAQPVAPSPITCKVMKTEPRELTGIEVSDLVMKFVKAARRAKLAGYDGVELHAAHGYLLGSFLSPYTNKRTDEYGGTTENRAAIIKEIIRGIKEKVDKNYPIIVRISADEFVEGGLELEESVKISKLLESYGATALHISTGIFESNDKNIDPMSAKQGWRINLASEIKKVVNVPIIGVGVIREPEFANEVIKSSKVDFIALGRALLADPQWPNKANEGNFSDINRCTTCGYCTDRLRNHQSIRCSINPRAGREESITELKVTNNPDKKVYVIGGGSTGMYTAMIAASKGFKVIIYEKSNQLGGLLDVASASPGKENWQWFKEYLIHKLKQLSNVEIYLNKEVTKEDIIYLKDDHIFDATGMLPKQNNDLSSLSSPIVDVADVLLGDNNIKQQKVIILGARGAGLEAAHYLAEHNNKVMIIARSDKRLNGLNIDPINRMDILKELNKKGVEILNNTDIFIDGNGKVCGRDLANNELIKLEMEPDIIVSARGFVKNPILGELGNMVKVGGSSEPSKILDGVWKAYVEVNKLN